MQLVDADATVDTVRVFRDQDGNAVGAHVTAHALPHAVTGADTEPAFSGESRVTLDLYLDNPRALAALAEGAVLRLTLDGPEEGGA